MLWDFTVFFLIIAFSYAFAFKKDVPPVVTKRALLFFLLLFILFNIVPVVRVLVSIVNSIFGG